MIFQDKVIAITGGTGSLGKQLVQRIMTGDLGKPGKVIIFSRDEAKQYQMKIDWKNNQFATHDIYYHNFEEILDFRIGDVRDYESILHLVRDSHIIIHAAALKQVPVCEYFPLESVKTNVMGAQNIVRAVNESENDVETVIGISTDKACKPINTYGMCKAILERIIIQANLSNRKTRFICTRYGNVIASRGSIIPLFKQQIKNGDPVTITTKDMTRFFLSLDQSVDTIFDALKFAEPGETYIPHVSSASILDLAKVMIGGRGNPIKYIGIRPGEKVHEVLISEEEMNRTILRGEYYVILPILPEIRKVRTADHVLEKEYSSQYDLMSTDDLAKVLRDQGHLDF